MPDLVVIYDTDIKLGAIVNADTQMGWGPTYQGDSARDILTAFVEGMPFDVSEFTPEEANRIFVGWLKNVVEGIPDQTAPSAGGTMGDPNADTAAAVSAQGTIDTLSAPDSQPIPPHDTDQGPDTDTPGHTVGPSNPLDYSSMMSDPPVPPTPTVTYVNCGICNPQGTSTPDPSCVACKGAGRLAQVV